MHTPRGTARHRVAAARRAAFLAGVVIGVLLDQLSKLIATRTLAGSPIHLGIIRLRLVANRGILMGIPAPTAIVVLGAAAGLLLALRGSKGATVATSLGYGLIAAGAIGNLIDRVAVRGRFPARAVVDWISLGHITFNVADALIVVGLLVVSHDARATGAEVGGLFAPQAPQPLDIADDRVPRQIISSPARGHAKHG